MIQAERARRSFGYFCEQIHPEFERQWFHQVIIDEFQAWWESEEAYILVISMPPGYGKSTYAASACAWGFARDPSDKMVFSSYGASLAEEHCIKTQDLMMDDDFSRIAPDVMLNQKTNVSGDGRGPRRTQGFFEVASRMQIDGQRRRAYGSLRAVGVGGSLTGHRCSKALVDDPVKNDKDVRSEKFREDQWRWFWRTLSSRKIPNTKLRRAVIMTRWHPDDLAGRIIARMKKVKVVTFEAIRDKIDHPKDPRKKGEPLWPDIDTLEDLEAIRQADPSGFDALYQQNPIPEEGVIIRPEWVKHYETPFNNPSGWRFIWSLDPKAGSKDPASSHVVLQLWAQRKDAPADVFLVDQSKGLWDITETVNQIKIHSQRPLWKLADAKLIEAKADGKAVLNMLHAQIPGLTPVEPQGDKESRGRAVAPFWRAGNVSTPPLDWFPWTAEYINEITTFPSSSRDDQFDAMTQAVSYLLSEETGSKKEQNPHDTLKKLAWLSAADFSKRHR